MKKSLDKEKENLFKRLDRIEEGIKLSTFDNTILVLMVFSISLGIALLSLGIPKLMVNNPYIMVGTLFFFLMLVPLAAYIGLYAQSILSKRSSFSTKIFVLTYLGGLMMFVSLIWIFLFVAWIYERWWLTPSWLTIMVTIIITIVSILVSILYIRPRLGDYFNISFKETIEKRKRELGIK